MESIAETPVVRHGFAPGGERLPRARANGSSMAKPITATTITMTWIFGSSNVPPTTRAAEIFRHAVPTDMTRAMSFEGPPRIQPMPKLNGVNTRVARIPWVPKTVTNLSWFKAMKTTMNRTRLMFETPSSRDLTAAAAFLIRNAGVSGQDISIYEADQRMGGGFFLGGSA